MKPKLLVLGILLLVALVALPLAACAKPAPPAKYPTSPIVVIVTWPAGGRSDLGTRLWAPYLEKEFNVPVVVANHPGGAGLVGAAAIAASKPDGYTLGLITSGHFLAQYTQKPPIDPGKFEFIDRIQVEPYAITVHADSPWRTLADLIAYGKANPGKLKWGHAGTGAGDHVNSAALLKKVGVQVTYIPYVGDAPNVTALAGKEVDVIGTPAIATKAMVEAGKLRLLAIQSEKRDPIFPTVPTAREQGVDHVAAGIATIAVPKGTPAQVITILEQTLAKVLANPELQEGQKKLGVVPGSIGRAELTQYIKEVSELFRVTVDELGLAAK